jgi:hypothetical protein
VARLSLSICFELVPAMIVPFCITWKSMARAWPWQDSPGAAIAALLVPLKLFSYRAPFLDRVGLMPFFLEQRHPQTARAEDKPWIRGFISLGLVERWSGWKLPALLASARG